MQTQVKPNSPKEECPVTSIDPSDQQVRHTHLITALQVGLLRGNGGRFLLLALGGFLAVRLALALLHLS